MRVGLDINTIATGSSTLALTGVFLFSGRLRPFGVLIHDRGRLLSLGAGVSIAYVFLHMMPEMADARAAYAVSATIPVLFGGMMVYLVALVGFMAYYGVEIVRGRVRASSRSHRDENNFAIHIGGFAVYVWMISYILVNRVEKTPLHIGIYTVAMAAHFLTIDHRLREEHGVLYERSGRYLLSAICVLGWLTGIIRPVPLYWVALMVAFVSGAIIMNSAIIELPNRNEGRFLAFVTGGAIYGLLLTPLG
jgi:hypothetical protein